MPVPISGGSSLVPLRTTCDLGSERIVVLSSCLLTLPVVADNPGYYETFSLYAGGFDGLLLYRAEVSS